MNPWGAEMDQYCPACEAGTCPYLPRPEYPLGEVRAFPLKKRPRMRRRPHLPPPPTLMVQVINRLEALEQRLRELEESRE